MISSVSLSASDPRTIELPCFSSRILCLREDILDKEEVAKKFEQEDVVLHEFQQLQKKDDDFSLLSNLFPQLDDTAYVPYCDLSFELSEEMEVQKEVTVRLPISSVNSLTEMPNPSCSGVSREFPSLTENVCTSLSCLCTLLTFCYCFYFFSLKQNSTCLIESNFQLTAGTWTC